MTSQSSCFEARSIAIQFGITFSQKGQVQKEVCRVVLGV